MVLTKAQAKSLDILEVARSLGMEMKRKSHREYYWAEHDSFKIDTVKNTWHWYSQNIFGDTINLVQQMRNVSYKEAMVFLETGSFPEAKPVEEDRKPFNYTLAPYEQPFVEARTYLKEIRGLSDDTIDFFLEKGVLAQAKRKDKDGVIEDVLVFKYLDRNQQLVGASLQGLVPDQERHPGKGYLKQIMYQSEAISGLNVSIGSPNRLIVTEAPIDLMSYYELHKGELNDVRLVAMEGLKEGVLSHYVLEILQERGELAMDERDYTKPSELTRTSRFLSVAAETSTLFQNHKYDDLITLAVDRDKAGTDFITKLREKKIPVIDARPPQREGQEKTDWNEILKQEKQLERNAPDNSRLAQARRKLERLKGEQDEAISRAYSHQALTNGQPMNDKRGGASFMRKQEQIEGQVFSKMDEIRQQEERVERLEHLEHQQHLKEMGLNRQGTGLEMSVQNIPRIREELEKAKRGESFFTKATLKRYQEELTRLEAISEQMDKTSIQPATQTLIDEGLVNQWQKQPNTYFVKGLRRVALELTEEGEFRLSSQTKYHPKTDEERLKVDELLAKQRQENVGLTPSNQEKSISPQPEPIEKNQGEAGWLEKNWDNLTFSIENKKTVVIDPTSIDKMVEEQQTSDNQESITTTEENAGRLMSYEEVKRENEALTKSLNNRIQSGELSIEFAPDFYLYDVFAKLGNSHPTKYLNDKRMEVLSPIHSLLTSIDNQTIDLYKKKGTPEQDSLYQALKPHQRTMGVDISTQFIGELAIAAYNTNKQIESLSSDSFGVYFGERTLDNLSQSVERMLEYPLIESGTRDFAYGFVTTPNTLYHYLEEQEGEVVLNHELLDNLMSRLDTQPIKIMEASEEKEKSLGGQETTNNSEQNKKAETKLGDFPEASQVAAPLPEANISQPLNDLSPSQTRSQPLLHFSINEDRKSIHRDNYHPISDKDLLKLNRYAPHLQNAAQWYLENVVDSQITYFYQDGADTNSLAISYNRESFMHLTGIFPYREGQTAGQTLLDFAAGNGQFDNILIANRGAAFDKLKVLPELPTIVDAESFYFGDLSDVEKFHSLNLDKAIRSNDQDVLLAFRTVDGTVLPASLMRLRKSLNLLLEQTNQEKIILGVFRERDDHIEQLSINEEYVKDKGAEMLSVLKNKQFEEIKPTMNVNHQIKISSYNFNNQEYSDLESMLQVGASYLQTPEGKAWLLEDKEYHQDILLKNFESKVSTPKQKLAVMSELGTVRVNGYDLLPGMAYYDALSDDGKYLDDEVIKRIDDELLNLSPGVSAEDELHYEEQLIDLAESRGIAEQENLLNQTSLDSATFTQVLDTVYNLGVPNDISKTPEEFHQAWNQYLDYAKQYNDEFDQIVAAAVEDHLLDTNSDFYKEWKQDHIYKENYHVRLQWAEERPEGPILPFKETELISYQDFTRELYKANQSFYQLHQDGLKQVTGDHPEAYISPTKIQFSIYAPDGELIQDGIRYNIGEEINPIAHKERLGTREMREYPELIKLDGALFNQYHLERLASELDISQFSYALEDIPYADQLLSQLPYGDLKNSPIGFTDSSHDSRLGFISFDGMDSVEVKNLSAWFEKLGVKDSPLEQVALVEKWQKEVNDLSEKVEQTIATVREEFEKSQEKEIKLEEQAHNKQELKRDADADGVSDEEELLQGTNPYDFRSKPGSKPEVEESLQADEVVLAAGSLAVADFIQNKDMAGLSRHLKEGIKEFLDSDKYKDYLTKMSYLNNYSNRNLRLILAQNPEASQVASFKQWKENFGRYVKKGEKALRIFKPMTKIKKDENNQPILDKNGKPETVTFFGLVPVFDVSQTEGKEMPKAAEVKEQLTDLDYANLYRALMVIAKENNVSVRFEEMENNKHGYYSVPENQIVLRSNDMNKAQIIKTFLHEMAHAELHHADNPQRENLTRSTAELQAESVAYVVSSYYGIDTSEYSFNYLSGWSADKETLADLEAQLDIVQQEAKSLMVRMDQALEQLRLSQEKQTKHSFEQKMEKFKNQSKQAVEEHKQELKVDAQSKKEKGFSK
ncbi:MAG: PBECR4 domain-containing protein [Streptococcus mitis]|nr:PBECR4 domain-containing protein [Streptococcus mitis]